MTALSTPIALPQSMGLPSNFSQLGSYLGGRELQHLYEDCTAKISLWGNEVSWINSRLYQIDPKLIGEKRYISPLKCLFRRAKHSNELKYLKNTKSAKQNLIYQVVDERYIIQKRIHQLLGTKQPLCLDTKTSPVKEAISLYKTFVKATVAVMNSETAKIQAASQHLFGPHVADTPEACRKLILRFFSEMPVFQGDDKLRANVEARFRLPEHVRVSIDPNDPSILRIDCKSKLKGEIDLQRTVTKEECERLDPGNPLIGSNKTIVVDDLRRFGTIDPPWWDWLKVKKYPAFGPCVVIKRENNTLHFKKGGSLLSKLEFRPAGIAFQAFWMEKVLDWTVDDFFLFLTKFKSV